MNKRFQVFVSSTYQDLVEERREVIQALLELDCIPCGMEFFTASDDEHWDVIKRLIDDCDYYLVVIAGRYGSMTDEGISYTQREYDYAVTKGIPVAGFVHSDRKEIKVGKTDEDPVSKQMLDSFIELVSKRMCKSWSDAKELGGVVSRSMVQLMKSRPRSGWVKADTFDEKSAEERIALYKKISELEKENGDLTAKVKASSEDQQIVEYSSYIPEDQELCDGVDEATIIFIAENGDPITVTTTWYVIKDAILQPLLVSERSRQSMQELFRDRLPRIAYQFGVEKQALEVTDVTFNAVLFQFLCLGYIKIIYAWDYDYPEPYQYPEYWLTEAGRATLVRRLVATKPKSNS